MILPNRLSLLLSFIALLFLSSYDAFSQTGKINIENNGLLKVEAEDFFDQTKTEVRKWYTISEGFQTELKDNDPDLHWKGASGGKYIENLPDTRTNHSEKLTAGVNFSNTAGELAVLNYKVNITNPGRYYVWVRAYSTGSEDNGIHVGIDGTWPESGQRMQWCPGKNEWFWDNRQRTLEVHCGVPGMIYLDIEEAGEHDIQFSMREDGFEMDQWILTTDKDFVPDNPGNEIKAETITDWELIKEKYPNAIVYRAQDFRPVDGQFYKDRDWLAINPNKFKDAGAMKVFDGPSGLYDVVVFGVGENDGSSTLSLKINNFDQGSFRIPLSTKMFEEGPSYGKSFLDVQVNNKDLIHMKAQIGSKDGKEYSRGRWSGIVLLPIGEGDNLLGKLRQEIASKTVTKVSGELKKWHKVTLTFDGPMTFEQDNDNPFMNYRLNVKFTHTASGKSYLIPGYYAADGNAGQTSAEKGDKWRVHFSPDEIGEWSYSVDFRKGKWVAVSSKVKTGMSGNFMDGAVGSFEIENTDKTGKDFRGKGRLNYVGKRYLQFAETGEYFLKQGPDAPENFLSFVDFDGTFHNDGHKDNLVKTWSAHNQDWIKGDPTWRNGKGKAIIGALNYLASENMNAVSFLTNNIAGDDQNVFPYVDYDHYDRIDVSKMDQWEILFAHAQMKGLFLHFKTFEVENQGLLDNGGVGANSKFYFRELMARFGHHLALNWNLGEENGEWIANHPTPPQDTEERLAMTHYFKFNDPYHHHLVIHNGKSFDDLLGPESGLTGPSVQTNMSDFSKVHTATLHWIKASKEAGFQWAVAVDEPGDAQHSLLPDADNPDHDNARKNALWGTLMAGGWGNEWYFGYKHAHSDITCQDYRSRDLFWDQAAIANNFFMDTKIPFWEMSNRNGLVGNSANKNTVYCLAKEDEAYVVYLNSVTTANLDLSTASGNFKVTWFNPKVGGGLQIGSVKSVAGGAQVELGTSPNDMQKDWVILVTKVKD